MMIKVFLYSDNNDFQEDLELQLSQNLNLFVIDKDNPDLVIIDEDIIKYEEMRKKHPSLPVIVLTTSPSSFNDDNLNIVIKKPFSLSHLIDTIHTANNLLDNSEEGYIIFNGYELRPSKKEIIDTVSGNIYKLTEKEVNIIKYLYKFKDNYISKTDLQKNVWQYNEEVATHTIETHIYRLRQKVETDENRKIIITNNGGYKLNTD